MGLRHRSLLHVSMVMLLVMATVVAGAAAAQDVPEPRLSLDARLPRKPAYPRFDSHLNSLVEQIAVGPSAQAAGGNPLLSSNGSVAVTIRLSDVASDLAGFLERNGGVVANSDTDYIEAYVPVGLLTALDGQQGVLRVETIIPPQPAAVTSQGVAVHGAPAWHTAGFTGAGVKVGVIDVGFIGYSGLMGAELPATVVARCYTAIGVFSASIAGCEKDTNHGTGVAEAVVDMAPGVMLYVANPMSHGDLKETAAWMVSQGVQVINHSVSWMWSGPGDGTSPFSNSPLRAVDIAVAGGALWVNAAGNQGQSTWLGSYTDTDGDRLLEFAPSVEKNGVQILAGQTIKLQARWQDVWGNATKDLDVYLLNSTGSVVAWSENPQAGASGQIPFEALFYTPSTSGTYHVVINRFSGAAPQWVQINALSAPSLQYATAAYSIANPAESANPGMLAVGAASWSSPNTIESFSSQGPTTDGRVKPDITAADRGDSVSYGTGGFAGTSQAAPHVAGMAALVLSRFPTYTPIQVADYLKGQALPRGASPNNTWGHGFAQMPDPNTPPTAGPAVANTTKGIAVSIPLGGADTETCELTFSIVTPPAHGALGSIANSACNAGSPNQDTASVLYTPTAGYVGSDSFTYKVHDGGLESAVATVTLAVALPRYTLSVSRTGTGSGAVSSAPAGVSCGATCAGEYEEGTEVKLTASPASGSSFTGWSGACSGRGDCVVTMDADKAVTATFSQLFTLTVTKAGTGSGAVYSDPSGVACGETCASSYTIGTVVTLYTNTSGTSVFTGWGGACSGTGPCQVTMQGDTAVTATFAPKPAFAVPGMTAPGMVLLAGLLGGMVWRISRRIGGS